MKESSDTKEWIKRRGAGLRFSCKASRQPLMQIDVRKFRVHGKRGGSILEGEKEV